MVVVRPAGVAIRSGVPDCLDHSIGFCGPTALARDTATLRRNAALLWLHIAYSGILRIITLGVLVYWNGRVLMEFWTLWTHWIAASIFYLSAHFSITEATAIIAFTLLARFILMPVSVPAAYKAYQNKRLMEKVKPRIELLKEQFRDDPQELARRTMEIYRESGITFLDRITTLNIGTQGILGVGLYQALGGMALASKFMWIANIAKPDLALSIIVGIITFLSMSLMPGMADQHSTLILIIPALVSFFFLVSAPSAIGIYWAASNSMTVVQTIVLRLVILRRERAAHS
jgi:YidC/Oxa1 family membrane protein insertase